MKAEKITVWGVHSTDGYTTGKAIAYYPIKAAADGSPENAKLGGYSHVQGHQAIRFDDLLYLYKDEINLNKLLGKVPPQYIPHPVYQEYSYNNGIDNSKYYPEGDILSLLSDGKSHSITKYYLLVDGDNKGFLLRDNKPIELAKFILSREIAVNHALGKLTEEERKLLGL